MDMEKTMPRAVKKLLFILFLLSSFVFIEPSPFDVFFVIVITLMLASGKLTFSTKDAPAFIFSGIYFITSLISIINADNLELAFLFFFITTYLCILMLFTSAAINTYGKEALYTIFNAFSLSIVISAVFSLAGLFGILPIKDLVTLYGDNPRIKGFFKDPNVFGPAIDMTLLYIYSQINEKQGLTKLIYIAAMLILVLTVLLVYSRAAWLALLLALLCYLFCVALRSKEKNALLKLCGAIAGFIIVAALCWMIADSLGYTSLAKHRFEMQSYDTDRFLVQRILLEKSVEFPLGSGPGQSEVYLNNFYNNIEGSNAAQQTLLRVLFENGFCAALLFLSFNIYLIFLSARISLAHWDLAKISSVAAATLYGMVLCSLVVDTLHWRHYWIIAGMILGLNTLYVKRATFKN